MVGNSVRAYNLRGKKFVDDNVVNRTTNFLVFNLKILDRCVVYEKTGFYLNWRRTINVRRRYYSPSLDKMSTLRPEHTLGYLFFNVQTRNNFWVVLIFYGHILYSLKWFRFHFGVFQLPRCWPKNRTVKPWTCGASAWFRTYCCAAIRRSTTRTTRIYSLKS